MRLSYTYSFLRVNDPCCRARSSLSTVSWYRFHYLNAAFLNRGLLLLVTQVPSELTVVILPPAARPTLTTEKCSIRTPGYSWISL